MNLAEHRLYVAALIRASEVLKFHPMTPRTVVAHAHGQFARWRISERGAVRA